MTNIINVGTLTDLAHSATVNFNGKPPDGTLTTDSNRMTWATGVNQGLVSPSQLGITTPVRVVRIQLFMAGQSTWTINLLDGTSTLALATGTTEVKYVNEGTAFLIGGQSLQVLTTGAGTTSIKMVCTVVDAYTYVPA